MGRANPQCPLRLGTGAALWQRVDRARPSVGPSFSGSAPQAQILPDIWVSSGHVSSRHREGALGPRGVGLSTCHCPAAQSTPTHQALLTSSLDCWLYLDIGPLRVLVWREGHGETRPAAATSSQLN